MSLFAQENPERKSVGIVKLETLNDYLDWGAQVVTAFIDENLLSTLDRNLPYYPTNAEDMTAKDLAHWNKQATLTVLFEFKAADIRRPIEVPDYDTVDYAMHDVQLNGNVRSRVIAAREAHHDSKQAKSLVAIAAYDVKFENAHAAAQIDLQSKARFRVWNKVLASLGNTFRRASSMSTLGDVGHLLGEINTVLHSDLAQDLLATRKLLARGTFEIEGMCQLTSWKYFVNFQAQRLRCLGAPYSEAELVAVFLDGLPAQPFGTFRQQVYNSKETFVQISDRARAYAAIPDSKMQLDQLLASHERSAIRPAQQIFAITPATRACNDFARGACARSSCKYSHNAPTSTTVAGNHQPLICSNCNKRGHSVDTCFGIHGFPNGNRGAKGAPKGGKGGGRGTQSERGRGQHGGAHANNNGRNKSYLINAFNNNTTGVPPPEVASWIEAMVEERYKQKYGNEGHDDGDTPNQQHGYMLRVVDVPQSRTYAEFGPQTRTCDAKILNSRVHSANAITMAIGTIREVAISACPDNGSVGANTRVITPQVLNVSSRGNADVSACILLDGGASIHATNRADLCFDLLPCGATVGGVGGEFVCETKGSLLIVTDSGLNVRLNDVFISALFPLTFISESKLLSKGCSINKAGAAGTVFAKNGSILFTVQPRDGLFIVNGALKDSKRVPVVAGACDLPTNQASKVASCGECALLARAYSKPESNLDRLGVLHRRLQHASFAKVAAAFGLKLPPGFSPPFCEACVMAKSVNHPHHEGARAEAKMRFQGLHCDFCGPFPCESLSGARYLLVFIDSYTGFIWDFYPHSQAEFYDIWHIFMARLDNEARQKNVVSWIRSDNAKVFSVPRVVNECSKRGIRQEFSAPYSQWQNGKAERCFGTVLPLASASLFQSGLADSYWEFAIKLAIVVVNRIGEPTARNMEKGFEPHWSKWERLMNMSIPTQLNGIYPFGCSVYKHVPKELRSKLEHHSEPAIYLGLAPLVKGVVVLSLKDSKRSVTAVFVAHEAHFPLKPNLIQPAPYEFQKAHSKLGAVSSPSVFWPAGVSNLPVDAFKDARMNMPVAHHDEVEVPIAPPRRSPREHMPAVFPSVGKVVDAPSTPSPAASVLLTSPIFGWLGQDLDEDPLPSKHVLLATPVKEGPLTRHEFLELTPISHKAAKRGPHYKYWFAGELREVAAHIRNETFGAKLSSPPNGFHAISMGFVYRNKNIADTSLTPAELCPTMFKVRAVVKGYTMVEGVDFSDTFAPTPSPTSIRIMIALATQLEYKLKAADVETAFLQSNMDKEVYVTMPPGYETCVNTLAKLCLTDDALKVLHGLDVSEVVLTDDDAVSCRRLLKGVPGIKQGSRLFYLTMRSVLKDMGFVACPCDPCVYWRIATTAVTILAVWVDDIFGLVATDDVWSAIVRDIRRTLALIDKGDVHEFLGMQFEQSKNFRTISVSQAVSIGNLLQRAGLEDCHAANTPCVTGFVFSKADCPLIPNPRPTSMPNFRGIIALANYIAVWTRPDIVWVVNKLCKFMANPGPSHVAALKRLLRYLAGTRDVGVVFKQGPSSPVLLGYTDSSHADCVDSSKSTVAFNMMLWGNPVSWYSHLDAKVQTCTNHAEYCALFHGTKEAIHLADWLLPLRAFLAVALRTPTLVIQPVPLLIDNHGAFALANDPVGRFLNKHIRKEHHFTQEATADGRIVPVECDTANNVADIGTKALGPVQFSKHAAAVVGRVLPRKLVKAGDNGSTHHRVFMIKVTDNGEHRSSSSPITEVSGAPRSDPSIFLRPDHGRCAHQEAGRAVVPELVCQDDVDVVRRAIRVVRLEVDELRRNVVGLSGEMHSRMGAGRQDLGELRLLVHAVRDEAALVRQATNTNEAAVRSTSNSLSICIAKMIEEFSQLSLWAIQVDASLDEARTLPLEVERARNECEQLDERMQFLDDSERFRSTRLCREVEEYRRDIVTMTARISEEKMETAASIRAVAASTEETVARYCRGTRTREVSAEDHVQELFDAAEGRWDAAQNRKLKFIHDQQACMKAAFQTEVVELKIMLDQQARGFQIQMQAQATAFHDALHAQAKENQEKWDIFRAQQVLVPVALPAPGPEADVQVAPLLGDEINGKRARRSRR